MVVTTAAEFEQALRARLYEERSAQRWNILCVDETQSTMQLAAENFLDIMPEEIGLALALTQTAGRGRQRREWVSPAGALITTVAFSTERSFRELSGLSLVVGLALLSSLRELFKGTQVVAELQLKWPNDLLDGEGRKLAGILIEIKQRADGRLLVLAGVGLNLPEAPSTVENATSLQVVAERHRAVAPDALKVATKFFPTMSSYWKRFEQHGFVSFREDWLDRAAFLNKKVSVEVGGARMHGFVKDVTTDGLLVLTVDGEETIVSSGEMLLGS